MTKKLILKLICLLLACASLCSFICGCDFVNNGNPQSTEDDTDRTDEKKEQDSQIQNNNNNTPYNKYTYGLTGSVWEAIKNKPEVQQGSLSASVETENNLSNWPIPITFLQEEGVLYYDANSKLCVYGKQPGDGYDPFKKMYAGIDENTKDNDVYIILQYAQDVISKNNYDSSANVPLTTWKLKYTLDEDDYQTLLKLNGDFRIRFFIQEMDKQYQPEVLSKSVVTYRMSQMSSITQNYKWADRGFPNVYVHNVDYNNNIITYTVLENDGYHFYDLDIRNTNAWNNIKNDYNLTDEEVAQYINIQTSETITGTCLTAFEVGGYRAGLSQEQAQALSDETDRIHNIKRLITSSFNRTYNYDYIK